MVIGKWVRAKSVYKLLWVSVLLKELIVWMPKRQVMKLYTLITQDRVVR